MQKNNLIILGAGESGYGTALLGKKKGWNVFVSDSGKIKEKYYSKFVELGIDFEEGTHSYDKILNADIVVKSPGIPENSEVVCRIKEKNIPVISEIEFASQYTRAKKICITGSNGKTTTTTLIYEILNGAGFNVAVAGNIGESFAEKVATDKNNYDWYVIELSSFQLDGMFEFKADIALLLNITPDHLNRYDYKMGNYVRSKFRISQNQDEKDFFVYNADDPETIENICRECKGEGAKVSFSTKLCLCNGAYYDGTNLRYKDFSFPSSLLQIKGKHNIANALAAIIACYEAGVPCDKLAEGLEKFKGVEHRLEPVIEDEGILWINDSKATNVDSVVYALDSMTRPTIWIAGGTDKGNDYSVLHDLAKKHVRALVCMGVDNDKLVNSFTGIVPEIYNTNTFYDAMQVCRKIAKVGDCVLLSPACASFDLFKNYEHRGKCFKEDILLHKSTK